MFGIWKVWKARNRSTFQDIKNLVPHICLKIVLSFFEYCKQSKEKGQRVILKPQLVENISTRYFDGVEKMVYVARVCC